MYPPITTLTLKAQMQKQLSQANNYPSYSPPGRSPSYYKRSPRKSYLNKLYTQLRRLLRDLTYYLKKNPLKVFVLVILPLVTGGLLSALLARLGIRLPRSFEVFLAQLGGHAPRHSSPSAAASRSRSSPSGLNFERESYEGPLGGVGNAIGAMGGVGGLMGLAKMFA